MPTAISLSESGDSEAGLAPQSARLFQSGDIFDWNESGLVNGIPALIEFILGFIYLRQMTMIEQGSIFF